MTQSCVHLLLFSLQVLLTLELNVVLSATCDGNMHGNIVLQSPGDSPLEGRVEVCVNGERGTVCADHWDDSDASIVCRQLGYSDSGAKAQHITYSGAPNHVLFGSNCIGNETILTDCPHSLIESSQTLCQASAVAGVICLGASCDNGDTRLVNGSSVLEGRVEICVEREGYSQWGTVCISDLNEFTIGIVCRQLHLTDSGSLPGQSSSIFGSGTFPILLDSLKCSLSSHDLLNCTHTPFDNFRCDFGDAGGVICPGTSIPYIKDTQPGVTSIAVAWNPLMFNVSHHEVSCSTEKEHYKAMATVAINGSTRLVEVNGLQPSTNYTCCVTPYVYTSNSVTQISADDETAIAIYTEARNHTCVSVETLPVSPSHCQVTSTVSMTILVNTSLSPSSDSNSTTRPVSTDLTPQRACDNSLMIILVSAVGGGLVCLILCCAILCFCILFCSQVRKKRRTDKPQQLENRFEDNIYDNHAEFSLSLRTPGPTTTTQCHNQVEADTSFNHLSDTPDGEDPLYAPLTDIAAGRNKRTNGPGNELTPDSEHAYDMPTCLSRVQIPYSGACGNNGDRKHIGALRAHNHRFDLSSLDDMEPDDPRNIYHVLEPSVGSSDEATQPTSGSMHTPPGPVFATEEEPDLVVANPSSYESTENFLLEQDVTRPKARKKTVPDLQSAEPMYHVLEQANGGDRRRCRELEGNHTSTESFYHVLEQQPSRESSHDIDQVRTEGQRRNHGAYERTESFYHVLEPQTSTESTSRDHVRTTAGEHDIVQRENHGAYGRTESFYHVLDSSEDLDSRTDVARDSTPQYHVLEGPHSES